MTAPRPSLPDRILQRVRNWPPVAFVIVGATVLVAVGQVTGAISSLVSLVHRPPPKEMHAEFRKVGVEPRVTFSDHLRRVADGAQHASDSLGLTGDAVLVEFEIAGMYNRECVLMWSLYDAASQTLVSDPAYRFQAAAGFTPDAEVDRASHEIWFPSPAPGRYFVRVELYDDKDVMLTFADTPPFTP